MYDWHLSNDYGKIVYFKILENPNIHGILLPEESVDFSTNQELITVRVFYMDENNYFKTIEDTKYIWSDYDKKTK